MKIQLSKLNPDARMLFHVTKRLEALSLNIEGVNNLEKEELALLYNLIGLVKSHELDEVLETIEKLI